MCACVYAYVCARARVYACYRAREPLCQCACDSVKGVWESKPEVLTWRHQIRYDLIYIYTHTREPGPRQTLQDNDQLMLAVWWWPGTDPLETEVWTLSGHLGPSCDQLASPTCGPLQAYSVSVSPWVSDTPLHSMRASEREREVGWRGGERERERENSNSNSKTLFYKDCSLGSVKNLSNN